MRRRVFDNPAKRAWWQIHVDAQRESGLTINRYCRNHRLTVDMFKKWRRELTDWEEKKIQRKLKARKRYRPISPDKRRQATQAFWATHTVPVLFVFESLQVFDIAISPPLQEIAPYSTLACDVLRKEQDVIRAAVFRAPTESPGCIVAGFKPPSQRMSLTDRDTVEQHEAGRDSAARVASIGFRGRQNDALDGAS